jgi:hypothetical protein
VNSAGGQRQDGATQNDKPAVNVEEIHRHEKRLARREYINSAAQTRKQRRMDIAKREEANKLICKRILPGDNKKAKPGKRPALDALLKTFDFIGCGLSHFDRRQEIPADYIPHSFNINRQYTDFVRSFIYPHNQGVVFQHG